MRTEGGGEEGRSEGVVKGEGGVAWGNGAAQGKRVCMLDRGGRCGSNGEVGGNRAIHRTGRAVSDGATHVKEGQIHVGPAHKKRKGIRDGPEQVAGRGVRGGAVRQVDGGGVRRGHTQDRRGGAPRGRARKN